MSRAGDHARSLNGAGRSRPRPTVALVGIGRWGRQLLRVLDSRCRVAWACHQGRSTTRAWLKEHYPHVECAVDYDEVLRDRRVEAVVLATPIATHATLARRALEAGKHLWVEKPLATTSAEADGLTSLAATRQLILFTGHVFLYHPVLDRIKQLTRQDPIRDAVMHWAKCGTFEEGLWWNLFPHEVSIAMALFGARPAEAAVVFERGLVTACDVASIRLRFDGGRECAISVNRCAAVRSKTVTMLTDGGRVLSWDHDTLFTLDTHRHYQVGYTSAEEPLVREVDAFLHDIETRTGFTTTRRRRLPRMATRIIRGYPRDDLRSSASMVSGRDVVGVIERLLAHRAGKPAGWNVELVSKPNRMRNAACGVAR